MDTTKGKTLFFYLPPSDIYMPSIALEVLKSYLHKNQFASEIKYFNVYFNELIRDFRSDDFKDDFIIMLPFLSLLAERQDDKKALRRIIAQFYEIKPFFRILNNKIFEVELEKIKKGIYTIIDGELSGINPDAVALFGISAKFGQWIPGIILAEELKKRFPQKKIVIGGFENQKAAFEFLHTFTAFDFSIWGEGEDPLLELLKTLECPGQNYENIPQFVYRQDNTILSSNDTAQKERAYDFTAYCTPDYSDYHNLLFFDKNKEHLSFPMEVTRGCHWNRCNFCVLNKGYEFRRRSNESIVAEIENIYRLYGIKDFFFVDNDVIANDLQEFEKLLDLLILSGQTNNCNYTLHADLIHRNLNSQIIKKIAMAGFKSIQIGYEGVSDNMLKKLNKSTRFAHNLLFMKFSAVYGINTTISGVIIGLPNEEESDILECIENLHFLRFQLSENKFVHPFAKLFIHAGSKFYDMLSETEKELFTFSPVGYFLPDNLITKELGFELLGYTRVPGNMIEWNRFRDISNAYNKTKFCYYLYEYNGVPYYEEYKENKIINKLVFDNPLYWDILTGANNQICRIADLHGKFAEKYENLTIDALKKIISELKAEYLLYHNENYSQIVTIINTDDLR